MRVEQLFGAALEQSTQNRYCGAVKKLARFFMAVGMAEGELPSGMTQGKASPKVLGILVTSDTVMGGFLAYQATWKYAWGTASGDISALRSRAVGSGIAPLPPMSKYLSRVLAGYKKLFPPGTGALPLPRGIWQDMLGLLQEATGTGEEPTEIVKTSIMASALLTIAFSACLRSGEYTGKSLRWSDVALSKGAKRLHDELANSNCAAQGGEGLMREKGEARKWKGVAIRLRLRHTKASPTRPVDVVLFPSKDAKAPCPVSSLLAHAYATGAKVGEGKDPVFAIKSGEGVRAVDRKWVAGKLKGLAKLAGVKPHLLKRLKPHSLRKGGATAASLGGASEEEIKALGRWKSDAVRVYVHSTQAKMKAAQKALVTAGAGHHERTLA